MFTAAFFIALSVSALAALPGDWARRNSSREVANLLNLLNGLAMVAIIALAAVPRGRPWPRWHPRHPLRHRHRPAARGRSREPQVGPRRDHELAAGQRFDIALCDWSL